MDENVNAKICIHHVGGRAGSRGFPVLTAFEADFINCLYDADEDCLAQVKQRNQALASSLQVLPFCLSKTKTATALNINYDPYTSSIYESNPDYQSYYLFRSNHDYVLSEVMQVMEKREIETVTLDQLIENKDTLLPDFLSIDTQGSEYDILSGATETLESGVLGLVLEAEFHPMYKDQKLFGDLCSLLAERGFHFVRFLDIQEASPFRAPVGMRSQGFQLSSDALFLRKLDRFSTLKQNSDTYLMLRKLAFIALVFNQFEYALKALKLSRKLNDPREILAEGQPCYLKFLKEIENIAESTPAVYPETFKAKYTSFTESKSRFAAEEKINNSIGWKQRLLKQAPFIFQCWRWLRRQRQSIRERLYTIQAGNSAIEQTMQRYGLNEQARILREKRIAQSRYAI